MSLAYWSHLFFDSKSRALLCFPNVNKFVSTMSQRFNVLRCYSCEMYQVRMPNKISKWQCSLCNAKQSVQQIYFQGSGKDCRLQVQQLNILQVNETPFSATTSKQDDKNGNDNTSANISQKSKCNETVENKWAKYLVLSEGKDPFDEDDFTVDGSDKNDLGSFKNMLDDVDLDEEF